MLCGSFILASLGLIFSPIYFFLIFPLVFLNRKLIYLVLKGIGTLKGKAFEVLRLQLEHKISTYEIRKIIKESGIRFKAFENWK